MVQTSATFPILLLLWIPTDDRLFPMARTLGDAVNKLKGQIQLSRIDIASYPSIAQAFQVQGEPDVYKRQQAGRAHGREYALERGCLCQLTHGHHTSGKP